MMLNHPTTSPKSTWGKKETNNSTIHCRHAQEHAYKHVFSTKKCAAAQSAKTILMSFFPSPSIRMELGQHSVTVGSKAGRTGGTWRREKTVFIKGSGVEVGGGGEGEIKGEE